MSAEPARDVALRVTDVGMEYSGGRGAAKVAALGKVSLEVHQGEIVSLIGPSGCGKTTLLNLIAGFMQPTSGSITTRRGAVTKPGKDRVMVFQRPALLPWSRTIDNVRMGPILRGDSASKWRPRAMELMKLVGLEGFERHYPYQLSGGMMQRVQIARTLLEAPELMLMDEPFGALDAQTRVDMWGLVQDVWAQERSTVVMVTHDVEEALVLSDRILLMARSGGAVAEEIVVGADRPRGYDYMATQSFAEHKVELLKKVHAW
jgi:NitT/TauT family transport system ATP-binding protein